MSGFIVQRASLSEGPAGSRARGAELEVTLGIPQRRPRENRVNSSRQHFEAPAWSDPLRRRYWSAPPVKLDKLELRLWVRSTAFHHLFTACGVTSCPNSIAWDHGDRAYTAIAHCNCQASLCLLNRHYSLRQMNRLAEESRALFSSRAVRANHYTNLGVSNKRSFYYFEF